MTLLKAASLQMSLAEMRSCWSGGALIPYDLWPREQGLRGHKIHRSGEGPGADPSGGIARLTPHSQALASRLGERKSLLFKPCL